MRRHQVRRLQQAMIGLTVLAAAAFAPRSWAQNAAPAAPPAVATKAPTAVLIQRAFSAAAEKVAPSVVTVEVEELELLDEPKKPKTPNPEEPPRGEPADPKEKKAPKKKAGPEMREPEFERPEDGRSTGLIIAADGWLLTSTFNLGKRPKFIKVTLADGRELPATLVARDLSRGIALLRVKATDLPVAAEADAAAARIGQWTLALGRSYAGPTARPAIQYGILSAKDRIMGRALQTDAALSPANYGGPLIDIEGRVLGVCVPLSPDGEPVEIGFYDSGIGFAIPLSDIRRNLDRLRKGEDLHPAFLGIQFNAEQSDGTSVKAVVKDGPADKAGLQKDDVITHVGEVLIDTVFRFRFELGRRLAGDRVELTVKRKEQTLKLTATLGKRPE